MNVSMKKQIFAKTENEYSNALRGIKQRVVSISLLERSLNKATKDGATMGLDRMRYVTLLALAFDISNVQSNLSKAVLSFSKMNRDFKRPSPTSIEKKATNFTTANRKEIIMNKNANTSTSATATEKKASFHLRVSNETFEIIKAKAESYGMSVSNYVEFVISTFDIMEIVDKIDELNERIDELAEKE